MVLRATLVEGGKHIMPPFRLCIPRATLSGQTDRPISKPQNQSLATQIDGGFLGSFGPIGFIAGLFNFPEPEFWPASSGFCQP
jgi:hypothetical protein